MTKELDSFQDKLKGKEKTSFIAYRDYVNKTYKELQTMRANKDPKFNKQPTFVLDLTPKEIINWWIKATRMHLDFDGIHVKFDKRSGIMMDYIAMVKAVQKIYPNSRIDIQYLLQGDEFECGRTQNGVTYNFKKKDPFADLNFKLESVHGTIKINDDTNFKGAFGVFVANDGTGTEVLELLTPKDLAEIVKSTTTTYIWNAFPGEMITKTVFKRVCKRIINDDRGLEEMINWDNKVLGNDFENAIPKQITPEQAANYVKEEALKVNDKDLEAILQNTNIEESN